MFVSVMIFTLLFFFFLHRCIVGYSGTPWGALLSCSALRGMLLSLGKEVCDGETLHGSPTALSGRSHSQKMWECIWLKGKEVPVLKMFWRNSPWPVQGFPLPLHTSLSHVFYI